MFRSREEADDALVEHKKQLKRSGESAMGLTDDERIHMTAARDRLAAVGVTIDQAADYFLAHHRPVREQITLGALLDRCILDKSLQGVRDKYLSQLRWGTDLHLDHLARPALERFLGRVREEAAAGSATLLLGGDVSSGRQLGEHLSELLEAAAPAPMRLVLGNHDAHHASLEATRRRVGELAAASHGRLVPLEAAAPEGLGGGVWLVAEDLKNTGKGNLFVIFGKPDIDLLPEPDGNCPRRRRKPSWNW